MRSELSRYFERVIQPELDRLETLMATPATPRNHYDGSDDHYVGNEDTLEIGDVDKNGRRHVDEAAYNAEQDRQAAQTPINTDPEPF